ncbi:hypothetical protein J3Q64DRAFT_1711149 [Phycomyces blakesleeanus]|uniref:BTB domain-containing protein n=2 Tax=Phycomyces blakesleeanus TaxID=4837 RepID=A0A163D4H0_PHYB8|nr:hypothetical protein PHYBLDRAFT_117097 [Phycomyces blakesleeanus NRRL 1555(-)]OAD68660.1 hypothetical protein PHYBLDRAFT_117097 [Phycomyces blakesleeanus NRRL 1555(-)]|eukprot:XP_018286700.1 hypothetical protein PHYBLDRAFT_117097 [Phycomyces blakesleeanus NRRL 1555(-)]
MSSSPITQVPDHPSHQDSNSLQKGNAIPTHLKLLLRGVPMYVKRDSLVSLPESLLVAIFPNGFVLTADKNPAPTDTSGLVGESDFDPKCFSYILEFFSEAAETFAKENQDHSWEAFSAGLVGAYSRQFDSARYSLLTKQAIVVLREELEYFILPQDKSNPLTSTADIITLKQLKQTAGQLLKADDLVFHSMLQNVKRGNNIVERELVDMLCDCGFTRLDRWFYRELESKKTFITSVSLVKLKVEDKDNIMESAKKLMVFWKKPARKCWWDYTLTKLDNIQVRLWVRRTWILELSFV